MAEETSDTPFKPSSIPAADYAAAEKTDASTAFGMRIAMVEAARDYAQAPADNKPDIGKLLTEKAESNPYLQAAGTSDVVAAYFESVIAREGVNTKAFADALEKDIGAKDLAALADKSDKAQGFLEVIPLAKIASKFNALATSHLKMGAHGAGEDQQLDTTLTQDFKDTLKKATKDGNPITDEITIESQSFSETQKEALKIMHQRFLLADKVSPPHIAHLISGPEQLPTDLIARAPAQTPQTTIDETAMLKDLAARLKAGPSAELTEAYYNARQHFASEDGVIDSNKAMAFRVAYEKANGTGSAKAAEQTWITQEKEANKALRADGANIGEVIQKYRAQLDTDMDQKLDRYNAKGLSADRLQTANQLLTASLAPSEEPNQSQKAASSELQPLVAMLDVNQDGKVNTSDAYAATQQLYAQVSSAISGLRTGVTPSKNNEVVTSAVPGGAGVRSR